jgi:hypothetical protein
VSFAAAGTCVIDANQAAGGSYSVAPQAQQSFKIVAAADPPQAISFTSTPPTNATVGGTYSVSATGGGSGNPVTFSIDASSTSGSCSISGAAVSFAAAGTCVIDANQVAGGSYSVAPQVQQSFSIAAADPPSIPSDPPFALGCYAGNFNPAGVESFASDTGANVTMAEVYLPYGAYTGAYYGSEYGWGYLTTEASLASWLSNWEGTSDQMVIGIPMVAVDGLGNPENTLAEGAAGDENSNFVSIAENLVSLGFGNAILRPGWEFDGTWFPWTVQSNADATNFATYWQQIVTAMRSVPGANFKFLWSPSGGQSLSWNINNAYPGNSYVDYVSEDIYDWSWDSSIFPPSGNPNDTATAAQSNAVFNELLTEPEGLNWLASFAQEHNEPIVIPEWAVTIRSDGHGLGDDPTFINNMYNWFVVNHVAWVIYFTDNAADNESQGIDFLITDGNFPNSLAAFKSDFG